MEAATIGQVLLCKMRGFPAWPGYATKIERNIVTVTFFGDETTRKTAINNCFDFFDSAELMLTVLRGRKNPLYAKSVKEAESVLGISIKNSILNRIN